MISRVPHLKRRHRLRWGCVLLLLTPIARAQDIQSWNEVDLTASTRGVDFLVPVLARTDTSLPNPQMFATGITADIHLTAHLTITPGYLFADLAQTRYRVHVPLLAATASAHIGPLTIADRNRFEKLFDYPTQPVRYRNRLFFDYSLGKTHAFLDDELFVNVTARNFNQNRLQAGTGLRLTPHLNIDLYYLQKNPATGAATHVIGSTIRIALTSPTTSKPSSHSP